MSLSTGISQVAAIGCLALMLLGVALAFAAQRRGEQRMSTAQMTLVWFPLMIILACGYQSGLNLLVRDLVIVSAGAGAILVAIYIWRHPDRVVLPEYRLTSPLARHPKRWALMLVALGLGFGGYTVVSLADFALQPHQVNGIVTKKYVTKVMYANLYYIEIERRSFPTTADVYSSVQPLSRVQAVVGRGTGNVFSAMTLAPQRG